MLQRVGIAVGGDEIEGILHLPDGAAAGGVVEMGGGEIEDGAYLCEAFADSGVAALRFAFRVPPRGGSTVDPVSGLADAAAAIRLLRAHPSVPQRIGVVGHSFGGVIAAIAAGRDSRLRAAGLLATPAERPELGTVRPLAELSRTRARVLLCYGTADERTPVAEGERYAAVLSQARVRHSLIVVDGADHFFSAPAARSTLLQELTPWLRDALAS